MRFGDWINWLMMFLNFLYIFDISYFNFRSSLNSFLDYCCKIVVVHIVFISPVLTMNPFMLRLKRAERLQSILSKNCMIRDNFNYHNQSIMDYCHINSRAMSRVKLLADRSPRGGCGGGARTKRKYALAQVIASLASGVNKCNGSWSINRATLNRTTRVRQGLLRLRSWRISAC